MGLVLDEAGELSPAATNLRTQQVVLWSSPFVALILLVLYLAFPGFRPPMSPSGKSVARLSACQIAAHRSTSVTSRM